MTMIPIYSYDKCKNTMRYIINLYDYVDIEDGLNVYYTVCCMLGEDKSLYDEPVIVRLLTDVIKQASIIVGYLSPIYVSNLVRKSFRRDNKWQREATNRINNVMVSLEQMSKNSTIM